MKERSRRLGRTVLTLLCSVATASTLFAFGQTAADWEDQLASPVYSVSLSGDGTLQVIGTRREGVRAFNGQGELLWEFFPASTIWGVDTSEDGRWTAVASEDRHVYLLDADGQEVWRYRTPRIFQDVAISRDGSRIIASNDGRQAIFLDRDTGEPLWTESLRNISDAVDIYGSGTIRVLTGTRDGRVNLFSSEGQRLWTAQLEQDVVSLAVNRNGSRVVVATLDGTVTLLNGANSDVIWQTALPREVRCTARHRSNCLNVAISGDAERVLVGTRKGDIYLLSGEDGSVLQRHSVSGSVSSTALALDGEAWMVGTLEGLTRATTTTASAAAYRAILAGRRNLLIGIAAGVLILAALMTVWVRRTDLGHRAWVATSRPVARLGRLMWRSRVSYILLLPTMVLLAVFNYYPAGSGLYHTFTDWNPGLETTWVGFEQVRKMFGSPYFWVGMKNALILVIAAVVKLVFPLIVAELIFHVRNSRLQYGLRSLFVIPLVLPSVVGILLWVNIYDPNIGLLNETLDVLGLENLTRAWLGDRDTAMAAIVAIGFPWINPFALLIFYGGLISIPTELFDAARVDGASWWARILRIDLPMLMSQLKLLLILAFIGSVQEFQLIFLTTAGGPGNATYTPALELYYNATRFTDFGLASAMGTFLFIIIMLGTILNLRYVRSQTEYQS